MRKNSLNRIGIILTLIFLMISAKFSITNPYPFPSDEKLSKVPTLKNIHSLIDESRLLQQINLENQYLIFFDNTNDFNDFLNKYPVKMIFRGLEGVLIQTNPLELSDLVKESSYITHSKVHLISNSPRRMITRNDKVFTPLITQTIESVPSAQAIGIDKLWDLGYKGQGITIGIFDEGVSNSHPDFSFSNGTSRIKYVEGFVNRTYGNQENLEPTGGNHGTKVAGYASGGGIENASNKGMAPESWILDADLDEGSDPSLDVTILGEIAAINWAIESGVNIINRSYGPGNPETYYWTQSLDPMEQVMYATVQQGIKKGVIFVHSVGNSDGPEMSNYGIDCGNLIEEISVGATDEVFENIASYSNHGPVWGTNAIGPDLVAPGTNIPTTSVSGGYVSNLAGTSYASPHIAGVAAVLLGAMYDNDIDVNPGSIKAALMATANNPWNETLYSGAGQINASAAYEYLMNAPKVDNHSIVTATNPTNITSWVPGNWPFQKILVGSESSIHFTFVSSELKNVSISATGNVSSLITFKEMQLENFSSGLRYNDVNLVNGNLSNHYSHHLILEISVPEGTLPGYYNGSINFRVNNTIIRQIPYSFNVENANLKVLFYTGASPYFTHNTIFGEFVELQYILSEQGIILNEYDGKISSNTLTNYDLLWIASSCQTYMNSFFDQESGSIRNIEKEMIINETVQNIIEKFVEDGGGLILSPYSNPQGVENLTNKWGIITTDTDMDRMNTNGFLSHFGPIGSTIENNFNFSGPIFAIENPAIPLAYHNALEEVIMASYDIPNGGRVVVVSGSDFMTNDQFKRSTNNFITRDIIDWLSYEQQLHGTYEIVDNIVSISLHTSTNHTNSNTGDITGLSTNFLDKTVTNITNIIPATGVNGWFNFTYTYTPESIELLNFSWNSDFITFQIVSDKTPPVLGVCGLENNSNLDHSLEINFWFYDVGTGINKINAEMTMDSIPILFDDPEFNTTSSRFIISKTFYPNTLTKGIHTLSLKVFDIAGNKASICLIFNVRFSSASNNGTSRTAGAENGILFSLVIFGLIITRMRIKRKGIMKSFIRLER